MHLSQLVLRASSPRDLAKFYVDHLAMTAERDNDDIVLGYAHQDFRIRLVPSTRNGEYRASNRDIYWKIGITLPNIDIAYAQLAQAGVAIDAPRQFQQIGYLCHVTDPQGFVLELLQHDFLDNRPDSAGDRHQTLGGGAGIGQVTLRVTDIDSALNYYRDDLGMRLLSIQPVPDYQFTLYFLAFTDEEPLNPELESVQNREWLWRRPYPTLELQHLYSNDVRLEPVRSYVPGFAYLELKARQGVIRITK